MISINLLRQTIQNKKTKTGYGWMFRFAVIFVIGAGIVVAGVEVMRLLIIGPALQLPPAFRNREPIKNTALDTAIQKSSAVAGPTGADTSHARVPVSVAASKSAPVMTKTAESTKTAAAAAGSIQTKRPAIPSETPMKLNADSVRCKIAFANHVLAAFSNDLPPDIAFTEITIDSFKKVSVDGMVSSRAGAEQFFASLPQKKFRLYPPPSTYIRPNGSQGFRFRVESSVAFGPEPYFVFVPVSAENLRTAVAGLSELFTRNGMSLQHPLAPIAAAQDAGCRVYALSGSGAYSDFVAFVRESYDRHISCAFRSVRLKAAENGKIEINAEVAFFTGR